MPLSERSERDRGIDDDRDVRRAEARMHMRESLGQEYRRVRKAKSMRGELRMSLVTNPNAEIARAGEQQMCARVAEKT